MMVFYGVKQIEKVKSRLHGVTEYVILKSSCG